MHTHKPLSLPVIEAADGIAFPPTKHACCRQPLCLLGSNRIPQSGLKSLVFVLRQDLAATAVAGGDLPEEQSPEEIAGDYAWDCEYNFDLVVSLSHRARIVVMQPVAVVSSSFYPQQAFYPQQMSAALL